MNKKILAVAIAAGLGSVSMAASAGDVTVYGKIHMNVDRIDHNDGTAGSGDKSQTQVSSQSSRLGFKGDEDLGNGMKAIFKIESSIDVSGETGTLGARNRYVGLSGNFGTILTGIHDLPIKDVGRKVDLFPEYVGDNRNMVDEASSIVDARSANMILYKSPNMNGVGISLGYSADTTTGTGSIDDNDMDAWSANATYGNGPLYVGFGYVKNNVTATTDEKAWRLSASYKFGDFKVVGLYQDVNDAGGTSNADNDVWGLGGAYSFGNNVVKVQYYKMDDIGSTANTGAKMWALGLDHNFSKRTTAYVAYAKTKNDSAQNARVNSGGRTDVTRPAAGNDPSVFSLGIIHNF